MLSGPEQQVQALQKRVRLRRLRRCRYGGNGLSPGVILAGGTDLLEFYPCDLSVCIALKADETGVLPITECTEDIILRIVQTIRYHRDRKRRTRVVQMAEEEKINFYKFAVGIHHVIIYKVIRKQSCVCLKPVFQCQFFHNILSHFLLRSGGAAGSQNQADTQETAFPLCPG